MKKFQKHYLIIVIFYLLQKNKNSDEIIEKLKEKEKENDNFKRIRCPLCNWQPKASSLWYCSNCDAPEYFYESCGTVWNTFNTGGKCPGCQHQWRWTSCLSCSQWSLHEDWYQNNIQNK